MKGWSSFNAMKEEMGWAGPGLLGHVFPLPPTDPQGRDSLDVLPQHRQLKRIQQGLVAITRFPVTTQPVAGDGEWAVGAVAGVRQTSSEAAPMFFWSRLPLS